MMGVIKKILTLWTTVSLVLMAQAQDYRLVWNEDFTDASLDREVWTVEVNGNGGWNNELQYYCEKAVSLGVEPTTGKHCLILTATKESYNDKDCTSGRVNTKNKLYYTYGKIEARIKFPRTGNGLWPAFWQMGNNHDQVGWPRCGETDLIELGQNTAFATGTQDRYFNAALHLGSSSSSLWSQAQSQAWPYSLEDTFHIITMVWTPTSIDMYMDKEAHPELDAYFHADLEPNASADYNRQAVFGKPNFLLANLAVGGDFPKIYSINQISALSEGPRSMYIDWIRIYQRGDTNESFVCPTASDAIEPENPQGVETVNHQSTNRKFIHNGQMYISHGGAVYTVGGYVFVRTEKH